MKIREWTSQDYHNFWLESGKNYLDRMEKKILKPLITSGTWIIDVGGGYGRLMDLYRNSFSNVVILDHSISMLENANEYIFKNNIKNVNLIAANVYSLPFIENSFDEAIMIRIIHHLENPRKVFSEVNRILKKDAFYILEYQNLLNINFRLKNFLKGKDINFNSQKKYEIDEMYWNFHPNFINDNISSLFELLEEYGGGIFWNRKLMLLLLYHPEWIDYFFSRFFGRNHLTHQIFLKLLTKKENTINKRYMNLQEILKCIKCDSDNLSIKKNKIFCPNCKHEYFKNDNIYDFRI